MARLTAGKGKDRMAKRKTRQTPEKAVQTLVEGVLSANPEVRLVLGIAAQTKRIESFSVPMYFEESGELTTISSPGQVPGL